MTGWPEKISEFLLPRIGTPISPSDVVRIFGCFRRDAADHDAVLRYAFLGDAVLSTIVAETLLSRPKKVPLRDLTESRVRVIRNSHLRQVAKLLGIEEAIAMAADAGGALPYPDKNLADALEAIIGLLYLRDGMDRARSFVVAHVLDGRENEPVAPPEIKRINATVSEIGYCRPPGPPGRHWFAAVRSHKDLSHLRALLNTEPTQVQNRIRTDFVTGSRSWSRSRASTSP